MNNKYFKIKIVRIPFVWNRRWFFNLYKYKYVKGVIINILGFNCNIRERDSTKKLIHLINN